jgi:hypothetical protein
MYLYFGILAVGYCLLSFARSDTFTAGSILSDAENLYSYLPALAGGFLFAAVFTDDLQSKNLATLVGFGMNKAMIVVSKFILMLLLSVIVYAGVMLLTWAIHAAFGWPPSADTMGLVGLFALRNLLTTVAFAAVAGILVYGLQRSTFAIVCYLILVLGIVDGLLVQAFMLDFFTAIAPDLGNHLLERIANRILGGLLESGTVPLLAAIEYVIYLIVSIALSVLVFTRRELEF